MRFSAKVGYHVSSKTALGSNFGFFMNCGKVFRNFARIFDKSKHGHAVAFPPPPIQVVASGGSRDARPPI